MNIQTYIYHSSIMLCFCSLVSMHAITLLYVSEKWLAMCVFPLNTGKCLDRWQA